MGNRDTSAPAWIARCISMLFGLILGAAAQAALAHALVMSSRPAANATVRAGTLPIELRFNGRIDAKRSRVMLRAPGGTESPLALHADASTAVLSGSAQARRAGDWAIVWQVLSRDGHVTRGEIPFRVDDATPK